jgi:hypothetical protein
MRGDLPCWSFHRPPRRRGCLPFAPVVFVAIASRATRRISARYRFQSASGAPPNFSRHARRSCGNRSTLSSHSLLDHRHGSVCFNFNHAVPAQKLRVQELEATANPKQKITWPGRSECHSCLPAKGAAGVVHQLEFDLAEPQRETLASPAHGVPGRRIEGDSKDDSGVQVQDGIVSPRIKQRAIEGERSAGGAAHGDGHERPPASLCRLWQCGGRWPLQGLLQIRKTKNHSNSAPPRFVSGASNSTHSRTTS